MQSIKYVTSWSIVITGLMSAGITVRVIYIILAGMINGDDLADILIKTRKKIKAAIIAICLSAFLGIIKKYYT